jgi:hypothetical protein
MMGSGGPECAGLLLEGWEVAEPFPARDGQKGKRAAPEGRDQAGGLCEKRAVRSASTPYRSSASASRQLLRRRRAAGEGHVRLAFGIFWFD